MIKVYHGANVREGQYAQSEKEDDEVNIALKEAGVDETSKQEARVPILTFNNLTN